MSDEKSKVSDKASEIAKNIWLAGVGAYGKAVDEAQGRLEKAMEPPKLFRDLVRAGTALEEDAREALEASSAAAKSSVEERISRVRENFHMQRPARIEDVVALHKKVDQLTRKVDKLTKALAELGGQTKPRQRKAEAGKPPAKADGKKSAAGKNTGTRTSTPSKKA
jgi:polyhydroxyalkanoate synthesis regulator phasin